MNDQWYYGRGSDISGPVSGQELSALANGGMIIDSDTIWKDGNEEGIKAGKVKNLFIDIPQVQTSPAAIAIIPPLQELDTSEAKLIDLVEAPKEVPVEEVPAYKKAAPKTGRATAGKGAKIVGQDGKIVRFLMKCTVCGHEDSSWKSAAIPRGTLKTSFYCSKCRKKRDAEIHGIW